MKAGRYDSTVLWYFPVIADCLPENRKRRQGKLLVERRMRNYNNNMYFLDPGDVQHNWMSFFEGGRGG